MIQGLVNSIMEQAFEQKRSFDSVQDFIENFSYKSDGTEILDLDLHAKIALADEYIENYGKDAFSKFLETEPDLSSAIDSVASVLVIEKALEACKTMFQRIDEKVKSIQAPAGFSIQNLNVKAGTHSVFDHFAPVTVNGECEIYRNIEGSGHANVYRETVKEDGAKFDYVIEVRLNKKN